MRRLRSILQTIWAFLLQVARSTLRGTPAVWNALTRLLRKLAPVFTTLWAAVTSHAALTIFGLLLLVAAAILLWPRLYDYLAPQSFDNRKDVVVGIVQGLGVIAIAVSLFFTYKNWQTSREGQITERFTSAIRQLGYRKLEVRLGGIYALERIAGDSPRDHWTIMEVLTAFVRENARWEDSPPPAQPSGQPGTPPQTGDPAPPSPPIKPRTDIQAILTVIGRRPEKARKEERKNNLVLDLRTTDLRRASLVGAHMDGANLEAAHMDGANLRGAHMDGANLRGAHMEGADLMDARMEGADLMDAHMERANLMGAHMDGALLAGAHMDGALLAGAHMDGAGLWYAHMERANLNGAHMEGANLNGAHMEGADLRNAHMEGAYLGGAIGLTREQLASAITDERTILPDYLKDQGSAPSP